MTRVLQENNLLKKNIKRFKYSIYLYVCRSCRPVFDAALSRSKLGLELKSARGDRVRR
ncbi:MAG: hypothetical protein ACFWT5_14080 [Pseudomonas helleri]